MALHHCQEDRSLIVWGLACLVDGLMSQNYSGLQVVTLSAGQLTQLEARNAEVESHNSALIQQTLELQRVEQELRNNLVTFVSRGELQDVQEKLCKSEQDRVCTTGDRSSCVRVHVANDSRR
jgi:hypothetical protein